MRFSLCMCYLVQRTVCHKLDCETHGVMPTASLSINKILQKSTVSIVADLCHQA